MKTRDEYLAMVPPHLNLTVWKRAVHGAFDAPDFAERQDDVEAELEALYHKKPTSLAERWTIEAEGWKKSTTQYPYGTKPIDPER